jgi:hypothetical protein
MCFSDGSVYSKEEADLWLQTDLAKMQLGCLECGMRPAAVLRAQQLALVRVCGSNVLRRQPRTPAQQGTCTSPFHINVCLCVCTMPGLIVCYCCHRLQQVSMESRRACTARLARQS